MSSEEKQEEPNSASINRLKREPMAPYNYDIWQYFLILTSILIKDVLYYYKIIRKVSEYYDKRKKSNNNKRKYS